ncbi:MAG: TfoX/Sxy family protein [Promethearchaeota archaeon]
MTLFKIYSYQILSIMPMTNEYREFILGQLEPFGFIRTKNIFGGIGLYYDEVFFAIIADDTPYFKVDWKISSLPLARRRGRTGRSRNRCPSLSKIILCV